MIRLLTLLMVLATSLAAQSTLQIRAAEHPDYSRLIVPLPEDTSWALSSDGRTTTVTFPGLRTDFDLAGVFKRMPRTRIVAVNGRNTALGAALELTLTCSCDVSAERIGSRFLAIDVSRDASIDEAEGSRRLLNPFGQDQGQQPTDPAEVTEPAETTSEEEQAVAGAAPDMTVSEGAADEHARATETMSEVQIPDTGLEAPIEHDSADAPDHDIEDTLDHETMAASEPRAPLESVREDLRRQLENAAAEGLLDAAEPLHPDPHPEMGLGDMVPSEDDGHHSVSMAEADAGHGSSAMQPELDDLLANSQIETRLPLEAGASAAAGAVQRKTCTSDAALNVARWSDGGPIADEIGTLRKAVVSDYGTVDGNAVADLARLYILNGFGREAKAVLTLAPETQRDRALLEELADVVEGRPIPEDGVLASSGDCDGRIAMWRAVAGLELLDKETERGSIILQAFSELPSELRRIAGGGIAGTSLTAGDSEAASSIIEILDRTPGLRSWDEFMTRAELSVELGDEKRADAILDDIENSNSAQRLNALILRANQVLETRASVPNGLIDDLAIEERTLRGTDERIEVLKLMAQLEALRGRPFAALDLLEEPGIEDEEMISQTARSLLVAGDWSSLPDGDFVRLAVRAGKHLIRDRVSETLRRSFAHGLNARGLPNLALQMLDQPKALLSSDSRRLMAETLLALDRPLDAIEALSDLNHEDAARLRADAHLRMGSIRKAFEALERLGASDTQRNKFAILSENWPEVDLATLSDPMREFVGSFREEKTSDTSDRLADDQPERANPHLDSAHPDQQFPAAEGSQPSNPVSPSEPTPASRLPENLTTGTLLTSGQADRGPPAFVSNPGLAPERSATVRQSQSLESLRDILAKSTELRELVARADKDFIQ